MQRMREALELRQEILNNAPSIYTPQNSEEKWATALLLAEAYFKVKEKTENTTDRVLALFRSNFAPQYIACAVGEKCDKVTTILRNNGYPVPDTHAPISLEFINMLLADAIVSRDDKTETDIKRMVEYMKYKPDTNYGDWDPMPRVLVAMFEEGYSVGDIASYSHATVEDVIEAVCTDNTYRERKENAAIIEDWITGKSVMFIAMKYSSDTGTIRSILTDCGYKLPEGHDCNIRTVAYELNVHYNNIGPKLGVADHQVVRTLRSRGFPNDKLAIAVGVSESELNPFLVREGI